MKIKKMHLTVLLLAGFAVGLFSDVRNSTLTPKLEEVEKIDLQFDDYIFASLVSLKPIKDGFVLLVNESAYGDEYTMIKLSKRGKLLNLYNKRGNGPGEFSRASGVAVLEKSILVFERVAPYIHEFSFDLDFVRDHRIKQGGIGFLLGRYIALQGLYFSKEGKKQIANILALYDRETLEFKKHAVEIGEIPAFVYAWGGFCEVDDNIIAGVYSNIYEIQLFDREMNKTGALEKEISGNFKRFYPWKKNPNKLRESGVKWMHSWTKMHSVFYLDEKYIVTYLQNKKYYYDVISKDGKTLAMGIEGKQNGKYLFTSAAHIWRLDTTEVEDEKEYALIKMKFK